MTPGRRLLDIAFGPGVSLRDVVAQATTRGGHLNRFVRYVLIQVVMIGLDYSLYLGIIYSGLLEPVPAFLCGRTIVGLIAYFVHARVTFQSDEKHSVSAPRYGALLVCNGLLSAFVLSRLLGASGPVWAKIGADVSLVVVNFFITQRFIFRRRGEDRPEEPG